MDEHKRKHPQEEDSGDVRTPRPPPKIEFPDPPNIENVLGGIFPFKRNTPGKKQSSPDGSPRSDSPTEEESPRVGSPGDGSRPQTDSPHAGSSHPAPKRVKDVALPKKKQYSGQTTPPSEPFGSPHTKKQYSGQTTPPAERSRSPPKQKQYSGQITPTAEQQYSGHTTPIHSLKAPPATKPSSRRKASPANKPYSRQAVHQAPSIPFIQAREPSFPHGYDFGKTEVVIKEPGPPTMSGFHFSPSDVAHAVQCAQVQGIIKGDSRRLRPPPGVKVGRSWLVEAIIQHRQQQQQHMQGSAT